MVLKCTTLCLCFWVVRFSYASPVDTFIFRFRCPPGLPGTGFSTWRTRKCFERSLLPSCASTQGARQIASSSRSAATSFANSSTRRKRRPAPSHLHIRAMLLLSSLISKVWDAVIRCCHKIQSTFILEMSQKMLVQYSVFMSGFKFGNNLKFAILCIKIDKRKIIHH